MTAVGRFTFDANEMEQREGLPAMTAAESLLAQLFATGNDWTTIDKAGFLVTEIRVQLTAEAANLVRSLRKQRVAA